MLTRPDKYCCIECGKAFGTPGFAYHEGILEHGPAYWADRGVLCSVHCSLAHHKKRLAEGTVPDKPAPDPFEDD